MLVLSRKPKQRIDFPSLGISVEILRVAGKAVRLGVEAPRDVPVLRGELPQKDTHPAAGASQEKQERDERQAKEQHELRNRIHRANLRLHLLQVQLDRGMSDDASDTLEDVMGELSELNDMASSSQLNLFDALAAPTRRALLVDDDDNERELLAGVLRMHGYQVDAVEDGLQAMTYLSQHERPDVVLLDMQMPRMDGRKTLSAIRRNPAYQGLKVFAVTGTERRCAERSSRNCRVDRWFSKPLDPNQFLAELERELEAVPA